MLKTLIKFINFLMTIASKYEKNIKLKLFLVYEKKNNMF
jgi:hypothetical protein